MSVNEKKNLKKKERDGSRKCGNVTGSCRTLINSINEEALISKAKRNDKKEVPLMLSFVGFVL